MISFFVARSVAPVIALVHSPSLWRIRRQRHRIDLPILPSFATLILFSGLQNCTAEDFLIFRQPRTVVL